MPKNRARKHKNRSKIARSRRRFANHSVFKKIRDKLTFGKVFAVLVAVIGIVGSYVTIFGYWSPRISVQPLPSVNPRDALSSGFFVTNHGAMDIYDVQIMSSFVNFKLRYISPESPVWNATAGTEPHYEVIRSTSNQPEKPQVGDIAETVTADSIYPRIAPFRSGSMRIPYSMPNEEDLDIMVIVWYRPAWYPLMRYETFRFVTRAASDGQIHWVERPE